MARSPWRSAGWRRRRGPGRRGIGADRWGGGCAGLGRWTSPTVLAAGRPPPAPGTGTAADAGDYRAACGRPGCGPEPWPGGWANQRRVVRAEVRVVVDSGGSRNARPSLSYVIPVSISRSTTVERTWARITSAESLADGPMTALAARSGQPDAGPDGEATFLQLGGDVLADVGKVGDPTSRYEGGTGSSRQVAIAARRTSTRRLRMARSSGSSRSAMACTPGRWRRLNGDSRTTANLRRTAPGARRGLARSRGRGTAWPGRGRSRVAQRPRRVVQDLADLGHDERPAGGVCAAGRPGRR